MTKRFTGKCCLCHQEKSLLKKSHIYPNSLYQNLFDEMNRVHIYGNMEGLIKDKSISKLPTGLYDAGILCFDCDSKILGKYEDTFAKKFFGKNLHPKYAPATQKFMDPATGFGVVRVENIRYDHIKLSLLGMLWKAHHSKQAVFDKVNLGPYEDKLREILLTGRSLGEDEFAVCFFSWARPASLPTDLLTEPIPLRMSSHPAYLIFMQGFIIWIFISPHIDLEPFRPHLLKPDSTLNILDIPEHQFLAFFAKGFKLSKSVLAAMQRESRRRQFGW